MQFDSSWTVPRRATTKVRQQKVVRSYDEKPTAEPFLEDELLIISVIETRAIAQSAKNANKLSLYIQEYQPVEGFVYTLNDVDLKAAKKLDSRNWQQNGSKHLNGFKRYFYMQAKKRNDGLKKCVTHFHDLEIFVIQYFRTTIE